MHKFTQFQLNRILAIFEFKSDIVTQPIAEMKVIFDW